MSVKQVGEAVTNKDKYFLCVVAVTNANLGVEDFKAKARFVINIGELLQNLWQEYVSMQNNKLVPIGKLLLVSYSGFSDLFQ